MTPVELRHAAVGYTDAAMLAAVAAGLRECPFADLPSEASFSALITYCLTDCDSWEWFPPPLTEAQVAAIHRRLVASANWRQPRRNPGPDGSTG